MSFMQPQVYEGTFYIVETDQGDWVVPTDVCGIVEKLGTLRDYVEGEICEPDDPPHCQSGWLYRMSAPGYMDATDWCVTISEREALQALLNIYGEDEDTVGRQARWEAEAEERISDIEAEIAHHGLTGN